MALAVPAIGDLEMPSLDPHLDADQILKLADHRRTIFAERDRAYAVYSDYYFGRQRGLGSPSVRAANAQGRPLMRDLEGLVTDGEYRSQRLAPVVDDKQALLGRMPASRVEPPDASPQGLERGQKLTKYLISTHELSRMDRQQAEMGWHLPCLGDSMYLLDVAKVRGSWRVVWVVVDPSTAFPAFMSGHRRYDMLDVVLQEYWDPYAAQAAFGSYPTRHLENAGVPVTIYISPYQRTVIAGKDNSCVVVRDAHWNLGFCPAVWVFNKVNGAFAQSDIAQSLTQQDALDFLTQLFLDGAVIATYAIPVVKGAASIGQDGIVHGPGAPYVSLGDSGDLQFRESKTDLAGIQFGINAMQQEIYQATGSSEARATGQLHSSIQTGRAIHAAQGPQATRIELNQQELGAAIQIANSMTLEMQEKAPYLGGQSFEIFGRLRGKAFLETFNPKDDIDGWYRTSVAWEPVTGMNLQQKTAIAYEAKAAELIDDERAMQLMGEEDPIGMQKRIEADKLRKAELEARIQGMLQGAQGSPGGGGGAPAGGPSPQAPPGPRSIARPPGFASQPKPLPTGAPQGVTREAVEKALQLVADKLTGTVAVTGELATAGTAKHIEVLISDYKDFGRIAPVLRALDPGASIKAAKESDWPAMAVRVA